MEKKKRPKFIRWGLLSLSLIVMISGFYYYQNKNAAVSATEERKTFTALREDIEIGISADGQVNFEVTKLRFNSLGMITELLVKEGQQVETNDILVRLDSKNLQHQVDQAQANYNSAVAKLDRIKRGPSQEELKLKEIAIENAKKAIIGAQESYDFKLLQFDEEKLPEGELITERSKLEAAKGQLSIAEVQLSQVKKIDASDLRLAQEAVNQAKAALEITKNNLADTILRAPLAGTVLLVNGKEGEAVASNSSGTSDFIVLADTNSIRVEANILEDDIDRIQMDQEVSVTFNATQEEKFVGIVTVISLNPNIEQSGIVTYKINILIENGSDRIKNGMTASVSFIIEQAKKVITIPNEAVKRVDGSPAVELLDKNGQTSWKKIKTGLTDGVKVEVKEGLKEGDQVIVRH